MSSKFYTSKPMNVFPLPSHIFIVSLILAGLAACQPTVEQTETQTPETTTNMLQHTVYFYLNDDVTPEEQEQFESGLKKLLAIDEIHKAELGVPAQTPERDVTDHSFGYSIFAWFETMEDYEIYAEHPVHMEFIEKYSDLWSEVRVYDSDLIEVR
ncbi:Stress responsive A/B Barrel Domain [Fodinibius sediminis]|uniref:Stress responsive A/B Barrel Domain n=2 Tax=Fodinibius sediminis TaxID=1214077 RepID=A0A521BFW8_9BACT|nr:Stress responsive A/B Barrel Domain [Fodinibius sediminis]